MYSTETAKRVIELLGLESAHQVEIALDVSIPDGPRATLASKLSVATTEWECLHISCDAHHDPALRDEADRKRHLLLRAEIQTTTSVERCREIWRHERNGSELWVLAQDRALVIAKSPYELFAVGTEKTLQKARDLLLAELKVAATAQECYVIASSVQLESRYYLGGVDETGVASVAKQRAESLLLKQLSATQTLEECLALYGVIPRDERKSSRTLFPILKRALSYATTIEECHTLLTQMWECDAGMPLIGDKIESLLREQFARATSFNEYASLLEEVRLRSPELINELWGKMIETATSIEEWQTCFVAIDEHMQFDFHVDLKSGRKSLCIKAIADLLSRPTS